MVSQCFIMNLCPAQDQPHQNAGGVDHVASKSHAGLVMQPTLPSLQELRIESNQDQDGAAVQTVTSRCEIAFDETRNIRGCKVRGCVPNLDNQNDSQNTVICLPPVRRPGSSDQHTLTCQAGLLQTLPCSHHRTNKRSRTNIFFSQFHQNFLPK